MRFFHPPEPPFTLPIASGTSRTDDWVGECAIVNGGFCEFEIWPSLAGLITLRFIGPHTACFANTGGVCFITAEIGHFSFQIEATARDNVTRDREVNIFSAIANAGTSSFGLAGTYNILPVAPEPPPPSGHPDTPTLKVESLFPAFRIRGNTIDFGSVTTGRIEDWPLKVSNAGDGDLMINYTHSGSPFIGPAGFATLQGPDSTFTLALGCAPTRVGDFQGTLTFTSNGGNKTFTLLCSGWENPPQLALSGDIGPGDIIDFGRLNVGEVEERMVRISNEGGRRLEANHTTSGPGSVFGGSGGSSNLAGEQHTDVALTCAPKYSGIFEGAFSVTSNGGDRTLSLRCEGPREQLSVSLVTATGAHANLTDGHALDFGELELCTDDPARQVLVVENVGGQGSYLRLRIDALSQPFSVDLPSHVIGGIEVGETQQVPIVFDPHSTGQFQGTVTLEPLTQFPDEVTEFTISLSGAGKASLSSFAYSLQESPQQPSAIFAATPGTPSVQPRVLSLGQATLKLPAERFIRFWNGACDTADDLQLMINVSGPTSEFTVEPLHTTAAATYSIAPGDSILFHVAFTPTHQGHASATLQIRTDAPNAPITTFALQGEAVQYRIPTIHDIASIPDPVIRNRVINSSYHEIDIFMREYYGEPNISNFATYAKHASRDVGLVVFVLRRVLVDLRQLDAAVDPNSPQANLPIWARGETLFERRLEALRILGNILETETARRIISYTWRRENMSITEIVELFKTPITSATVSASPVAPLVIDSLPDLIDTVERVYYSLATGNATVYLAIAPHFRDFLEVANRSPDGIPTQFSVGPALDPAGMLTEAFLLYGEAKRLQAVAQDPETHDLAGVWYRRWFLLYWANLYCVFHEQLYVVQQFFDGIESEIKALDGAFVHVDTCDIRILANDWQDFYSRMGIDKRFAPSDPTSVTYKDFPWLLPEGDPLYPGTIVDYFMRYLEGEPCIYEAPLPVP